MTGLSPQPNDRRPAFAVPAGSHLVACLLAASLLSVVFTVVYGGADYITGLRSNFLRVDFAFEQHLPFVPEVSPLYSSLYLMFAAVPFVLRTPGELRSYVWIMVGITVIAGIGFLLIPAELAFRLPVDRSRLPVTFQMADRLNLTYNLCPSLHVAYAMFHAEIFRHQTVHRTWLFHLWAFGIALAAWLTWQHHLIDLVAGCLLGMGGGACYRTVCRGSET